MSMLLKSKIRNELEPFLMSHPLVHLRRLKRAMMTYFFGWIESLLFGLSLLSVLTERKVSLAAIFPVASFAAYMG
jgi:hypothetical protein